MARHEQIPAPVLTLVGGGSEERSPLLMQNLRLQLCQGEAATRRMVDQAFGQAWDDLHDACPWATALQTRAFASIWYSVYDALWEPLLVLAEDEQSCLCGLFALAVHRTQGTLAHVGAHQAEYQVWLSRAEAGDAFIEAALDQLALRFPVGSLDLRWLPGSAPTGWLEASRPWASRVRLQSFPHPLMKVGQEGTIEESLRKKNNKHRMNRLRELGPVRLEVFRSRKEIEPFFDRLVEFCDFRDGARYACLPFQDDPLKREFYLRLVDAPEITHASVLMAGEHILAANIGSRGPTSVALGLVTQSPFISKYSPGVLLFLLLGRELGLAGFQNLDLTPSVDLRYKERFADHFSTAHMCHIFFRARDARRNKAVGVLKASFRRLGLKPDTLLRRLRGAIRLLRGDLMRCLAQGGRKLIGVRTGLRIYRLDPNHPPPHPEAGPFTRDALQDLMRYRPVSPQDCTTFEFLKEAFDHLKDGGHAFTLVEGDRLLASAWVSPVPGPLDLGLGYPVDLSAGSVLLWDERLHPSVDNDALRRALLQARLPEAIRLVKPGSGIFACACDTDQDAFRRFESLGFQPYAHQIRQVRWGWTAHAFRLED